MTAIHVTGPGGRPFGRILVRQGRLVEREGMFTRYHRVGFEYPNGGTEWYDISSLPFRFGAEHTFSLFGTVSAALSFYLADGADGAEDWAAYTEIPVGYAEMTRSTWRVTGDECTSWTTGDKHRSKRAKVTRYYEERVSDAVSRTLIGWDGWEGAGTFDSLDTTQCFDQTSARWYTVPVAGDPLPNGDIPEVQHSVRFTGEMTAWVPTLAAEWTEGGTAWR